MKVSKDMGIADICSRLKMKIKGRSGPATGFRKIRVDYGLFYAPAWCVKPAGRIHPSMVCEQMLNDSVFASLYDIARLKPYMTEPLCRPAKYTECLSSRCIYARGPYHGVALSRYIRRFMKIYMRGPELNTAYTRLHEVLYNSYDMYSAQWHKGNDGNK